MAEIDITKLLDVVSGLTNKAAEKLSSTAGKKVEVAPAEARPFDADGIRGSFTEQPISIQIGWSDNALGVVCFVDKSFLSEALPILTKKEGPFKPDDEKTLFETENVTRKALQAIGDAFLERLGDVARFGQVKALGDEGPDVSSLSSYWMVFLDVRIESLSPSRVVVLLSTKVLQAILGIEGELATSRESKAATTGEDSVPVQPGEFSPFEDSGQGFGVGKSFDVLMDVELPISVELGRVDMQVKRILALGPGAVVELNRFSGEPVDMLVNNKKFAEGEVVVVDQNFGVRITALVGATERLRAANVEEKE